MTKLSRHPLPISGSSYVDGNLYIRLSGHSKALIKAHHSIGGDLIQQADIFWKDLNEQRLDFFQKPSSLLRISLPAASPALPLRGEWLYDWGGSLRWLKTDEPTQALTLAEKNNETFVSSFDSQIPISQSLPSELGKIHQQLRAAFDPEKILNRGCRLDQLIYRR
jgi:glycolate oxidase FAD binding subunit